MSEIDDLSPAERELEMALRSLRPTPSGSGVMEAARAAGRRVVRRRRRLWRAVAAAAAVVAASGIWFALGPRETIPDNVNRQKSPSDRGSDTPIKQPLGPPTLMDYRRALARSPDELEALLDRQATTDAPPGKQFTPVTVLTLSASNDRSLLGDL